MNRRRRLVDYKRVKSVIKFSDAKLCGHRRNGQAAASRKKYHLRIVISVFLCQQTHTPFWSLLLLLMPKSIKLHDRMN